MEIDDGGNTGGEGNAFDDNDLNLQLAEGLTSLRDCVRNMGNAEVNDEFAGTFIGDETNIVDAVNAVEAWNTQEESKTTDAFSFEQICEVAASDALIEAEKVFADMMAAEEDVESEEQEINLEDNDDVEGSDCEEEKRSAGDMDSSSGSDEDSDEDEDIVDERLIRATPAKMIQIMEEQCGIFSRTAKFALESGKFDHFPYAD